MSLKHDMCLNKILYSITFHSILFYSILFEFNYEDLLRIYFFIPRFKYMKLIYSSFVSKHLTHGLITVFLVHKLRVLSYMYLYV